MKSYHHGNLKQELIDCASKLCERDGYTKLSIRSLAKESGVSQTAPYRHFETKEALYASVATDGFKKLSKACHIDVCLLYTSPSPRDLSTSRMPSSA